MSCDMSLWPCDQGTEPEARQRPIDVQCQYAASSMRCPVERSRSMRFCTASGFMPSRAASSPIRRGRSIDVTRIRRSRTSSPFAETLSGTASSSWYRRHSSDGQFGSGSRALPSRTATMLVHVLVMKAPMLLSSLPPEGALAADRRSRGLLAPTLLPSLPPEGALAADRRSRIRARALVGPFHARVVALRGGGELK